LLLDDVYLPLAAFFKGKRIVLEMAAKAYDSPGSLKIEFNRKVRTAGLAYTSHSSLSAGVVAGDTRLVPFYVAQNRPPVAAICLSNLLLLRSNAGSVELALARLSDNGYTGGRDRRPVAGPLPLETSIGAGECLRRLDGRCFMRRPSHAGSPQRLWKQTLIRPS